MVASSDDLVNLEIALSAREANPRVRIVVRLFDEEFASLQFDGLHSYI